MNPSNSFVRSSRGGSGGVGAPSNNRRGSASNASQHPAIDTVDAILAEYDDEGSPLAPPPPSQRRRQPRGGGGGGVYFDDDDAMSVASSSAATAATNNQSFNRRRRSTAAGEGATALAVRFDDEDGSTSPLRRGGGANATPTPSSFVMSGSGSLSRPLSPSTPTTDGAAMPTTMSARSSMMNPQQRRTRSASLHQTATATTNDISSAPQPISASSMFAADRQQQQQQGQNEDGSGGGAATTTTTRPRRGTIVDDQLSQLVYGEKPINISAAVAQARDERLAMDNLSLLQSGQLGKIQLQPSASMLAVVGGGGGNLRELPAAASSTINTATSLSRSASIGNLAARSGANPSATASAAMIAAMSPAPPLTSISSAVGVNLTPSSLSIPMVNPYLVQHLSSSGSQPSAAAPSATAPTTTIGDAMRSAASSNNNSLSNANNLSLSNLPANAVGAATRVPSMQQNNNNRAESGGTNMGNSPSSNRLAPNLENAVRMADTRVIIPSLDKQHVVGMLSVGSHNSTYIAGSGNVPFTTIGSSMEMRAAAAAAQKQQQKEQQQQQNTPSSVSAAGLSGHNNAVSFAANVAQHRHTSSRDGSLQRGGGGGQGRGASAGNNREADDNEYSDESGGDGDEFDDDNDASATEGRSNNHQQQQQQQQQRHRFSISAASATTNNDDVTDDDEVDSEKRQRPSLSRRSDDGEGGGSRRGAARRNTSRPASDGDGHHHVDRNDNDDGDEKSDNFNNESQSLQSTSRRQDDESEDEADVHGDDTGGRRRNGKSGDGGGSVRTPSGSPPPPTTAHLPPRRSQSNLRSGGRGRASSQSKPSSSPPTSPPRSGPIGQQQQQQPPHQQQQLSSGNASFAMFGHGNNSFTQHNPSFGHQPFAGLNPNNNHHNQQYPMLSSNNNSVAQMKSSMNMGSFVFPTDNQQQQHDENSSAFNKSLGPNAFRTATNGSPLVGYHAFATHQNQNHQQQSSSPSSQKQAQLHNSAVDMLDVNRQAIDSMQIPLQYKLSGYAPLHRTVQMLLSAMTILAADTKQNSTEVSKLDAKLSSETFKTNHHTAFVKKTLEDYAQINMVEDLERRMNLRIDVIMDKLSATTANITATCEILGKRIDSATGDIISLKTKLDTMGERTTKTMQSNDAMQKEFIATNRTEILNAVDTLSAELKSLKSSVDNNANSAKASFAGHAETLSEIKTSVDGLEKTQNAHSDNFEVINAELSKKFASIAAEYRNLSTSVNRLTSNHESFSATIANDVKQLQSDLPAAVERIENNTSHMNNLIDTRLVNLREDIIFLQNEIAGHKMDVSNNAKFDKNAMFENLKNVENSIAGINNKIAAISELQTETSHHIEQSFSAFEGSVRNYTKTKIALLSDAVAEVFSEVQRQQVESRNHSEKRIIAVGKCVAGLSHLLAPMCPLPVLAAIANTSEDQQKKMKNGGGSDALDIDSADDDDDENSETDDASVAVRDNYYESQDKDSNFVHGGPQQNQAGGSPNNTSSEGNARKKTKKSSSSSTALPRGYVGVPAATAASTVQRALDAITQEITIASSVLSGAKKSLLHNSNNNNNNAAGNTNTAPPSAAAAHHQDPHEQSVFIGSRSGAANNTSSASNAAATNNNNALPPTTTATTTLPACLRTLRADITFLSNCKVEGRGTVAVRDGRNTETNTSSSDATNQKNAALNALLALIAGTAEMDGDDDDFGDDGSGDGTSNNNRILFFKSAPPSSSSASASTAGRPAYGMPFSSSSSSMSAPAPTPATLEEIIRYKLFNWLESNLWKRKSLVMVDLRQHRRVMMSTAAASQQLGHSNSHGGAFGGVLKNYTSPNFTTTNGANERTANSNSSPASVLIAPPSSDGHGHEGMRTRVGTSLRQQLFIGTSTASPTATTAATGTSTEIASTMTNRNHSTAAAAGSGSGSGSSSSKRDWRSDLKDATSSYISEQKGVIAQQMQSTINVALMNYEAEQHALRSQELEALMKQQEELMTVRLMAEIDDRMRRLTAAAQTDAQQQQPMPLQLAAGGGATIGAGAALDDGRVGSGGGALISLPLMDDDELKRRIKLEEDERHKTIMALMAQREMQQQYEKGKKAALSSPHRQQQQQQQRPSHRPYQWFHSLTGTFISLLGIEIVDASLRYPMGGGTSNHSHAAGGGGGGTSASFFEGYGANLLGGANGDATISPAVNHTNGGGGGPPAEGVIVSRVLEGGPSYSAGVEEGDLIVAINHHEVLDQASFLAAIDYMPALAHAPYVRVILRRGDDGALQSVRVAIAQ